jgi:hypothetical protein
MTTKTQTPTPLHRYIFDDAGRETGATFDVETSRSGDVSVIFHSRGTTAGTRAYRAGLCLLLSRLAAHGVAVHEVCVETRTTKELSRTARRVYKASPRDVFANLSAMVQTVGADPVRAKLGSAAAKVGRPPGAKGGGNGTKRLRLYLGGGHCPVVPHAAAVAHIIARG